MQNAKLSWTAPISTEELRPLVFGVVAGLFSSGLMVVLLANLF